jgi:hypothetical protein
MTEYTVLIIGDEDRWWTTMNVQERKAAYAEYARFGEALAEGGHKVVGGGELTHSKEARSIRPGGGVVTEGPFTESTEQVGGFYQVETDDLDGLLECCQIIARNGDGIQVRPNVDPASRPS